MKYKVGDRVRINCETHGERVGVIQALWATPDASPWPYVIDADTPNRLYAEKDSPDLEFHDYIIGLAE